MKIDLVKTIRIDDLKNAGGEIPAWVDPLLSQLNSFIENVGKALQQNLTFQDNVLCKVNTQTLTHGMELEINPNTKIKVFGVIPIDSSGTPIDQFGWTRKANGNIGVTAYFNAGTVTTTVKCTTLILLG